MKDFVASEDGVIVTRIKSAGGVILGKTNVPANLQGYPLWKIIRGPDSSDFEVARIDWRPPSGRPLEQFRVAWTDGFEEYVAGTETREHLAALAARIEHAGARVEKAAPAIYPRATEVFVQLLGALLGQDMPWLVRKIFPVFVARGLLKGQPASRAGAPSRTQDE
jgi:Asp-tRNA(Asn)/Glu-tRNA(Gln) amidotransferase A subunit family amidase